MSGTYQQVQKYSGSLYGTPRYQGIEYDWEVPDNIVVGSPGGVSTVHHHYTKGFYGRGETSSDVYAGQDQRYNAGPYGNLYQSGQTAAQYMGYYTAAPDYQYWQNEEPQQYSHSQQPGTTWAPPVLHGFPTTQKKAKENFEMTSDPSFELITPSDETSEKMEISVQSKMSPWLLLLLLFLLFIVFYLWTIAGDRFLVQYVHEGKKPSWKRMIMYAVIATVILGGALYIAGFPLVSVET